MPNEVHYCSLGSFDFQSDVSCRFEPEAGFTTQVAHRRIVGDVPPLADIHQGLDPYLQSFETQARFVGAAERQRIGLPYDGQVFRDATLVRFRARLILLRQTGYRIPQAVIDRVGRELSAIGAAAREAA